MIQYNTFLFNRALCAFMLFSIFTGCQSESNIQPSIVGLPNEKDNPDDVIFEPPATKDEEDPPINTFRLHFSNISDSELTVTWSKLQLSTDPSQLNQLQYKLVKANNADSISTIEKADAHHEILQDYTPSLESVKATGLTANTRYYFALLTKDQTNNKGLVLGETTTGSSVPITLPYSSDFEHDNPFKIQTNLQSFHNNDDSGSDSGLKARSGNHFLALLNISTSGDTSREASLARYVALENENQLAVSLFARCRADADTNTVLQSRIVAQWYSNIDGPILTDSESYSNYQSLTASYQELSLNAIPPKEATHVLIKVQTKRAAGSGTAQRNTRVGFDDLSIMQSNSPAAQTPTFSPEWETSSIPISVSIAAEDADLISYTLDGTMPKCYESTSIAPGLTILIPTTSRVKAIACSPHGSSAVRSSGIYAVTPDFIANGSFEITEAAQPLGWHMNSPGEAVVRQTGTAVYPYAGESVGSFTSLTADISERKLLSSCFPVSPGETISANVQFFTAEPVNNTEASVGIQLYEDANCETTSGSSSYTTVSLPSKNNWHLISKTRTVQNNNRTAARVILRGRYIPTRGNGTSTLFFDAVSVIKKE